MAVNVIPYDAARHSTAQSSAGLPTGLDSPNGQASQRNYGSTIGSVTDSQFASQLVSESS